jgi:hypothetical protein
MPREPFDHHRIDAYRREAYKTDVLHRYRPRVSGPLRKLLKQASPEQLARARTMAINHYIACHEAGCAVERPEAIMWEALTVVMKDDDELTARPRDRRELFTARSYEGHYTEPF